MATTQRCLASLLLFCVIGIRAHEQQDHQKKHSIGVIALGAPPNSKSISVDQVSREGLGESTPPVAIGYLGTGYDIIFGNPFGQDGKLDPGFRAPVIDPEFSQDIACPDMQWLCPKHGYIRRKVLCHHSSRATTVSSSQEYQSSLSKQCSSSSESSKSIEASVEGSGWGVSASASYAASQQSSFSGSQGFKSESSSTATQDSQSFDSSTLCSEYEAGFNFLYNLKTSADFTDAVKRLPAKYSYPAYEAFIGAYGTHFVFSAEFGGKIINRVRMKTSEVQKLQSKGVDVARASAAASSQSASVSASYSGFGVSAGGSVSGSKSSSNSQSSSSSSNSASGSAFASSNKEVTTIIIGGNPGADWKEWSGSLAERPMPITYQIRPLFFAFGKENKAKAENFAKAVGEYSAKHGSTPSNGTGAQISAFGPGEGFVYGFVMRDASIATQGADLFAIKMGGSSTFLVTLPPNKFSSPPAVLASSVASVYESDATKALDPRYFVQVTAANDTAFAIATGKGTAMKPSRTHFMMIATNVNSQKLGILSGHVSKYGISKNELVDITVVQGGVYRINLARPMTCPPISMVTVSSSARTPTASFTPTYVYACIVSGISTDRVTITCGRDGYHFLLPFSFLLLDPSAVKNSLPQFVAGNVESNGKPYGGEGCNTGNFKLISMKTRGYSNISFTTPFQELPLVYCQQVYPKFTSHKVGGDMKDNCVVLFVSKTYAVVVNGDALGNSMPRAFSFMAFAPSQAPAFAASGPAASASGASSGTPSSSGPGSATGAGNPRFRQLLRRNYKRQAHRRHSKKQHHRHH